MHLADCLIDPTALTPLLRNLYDTTVEFDPAKTTELSWCTVPTKKNTQSRICFLPKKNKKNTLNRQTGKQNSSFHGISKQNIRLLDCGTKQR